MSIAKGRAFPRVHHHDAIACNLSPVVSTQHIGVRLFFLDSSTRGL